MFWCLSLFNLVLFKKGSDGYPRGLGSWQGIFDVENETISFLRSDIASVQCALLSVYSGNNSMSGRVFQILAC